MRRLAIAPDRVVHALLVLAIVGGIGLGGWGLVGGGVLGGVVAVICAGAAAAAWLGLVTPGDPGGWGGGRIAVPGPVRLLIEGVGIGMAAAAIWLVASRAASETLLTTAGLVYLITWDRVAWLLGRRPGCQ